ncbi:MULTISPECIES: flagellar biosynthesis protein FlhF [unclassified Bacillus (in: firmicutes)]|uniref:flagellar biosynthesis protein FlhF n=1 Tax=unclassified Bacillus (in: firmicutes) TaxID=185979 RepID=UPI0008E59765|nr:MULTISPECIES: flagellar biosynthesis protein FlhF [unclassified Bacillus (in: firmicutes)]SFA73829.1 flagellar biosynthesis protein FlhF [Bacillus sp. UNCCL13]SFQ64048.1 flagellar biosynthesis protein FlhF [Bacillus sp. cl95]
MKIKKIIADSMPEALKTIRAELGDEAVILNSKVVYGGGFLGFFRKKQIEVIAAIDPIPKEEKVKNVREALPTQWPEKVASPKPTYTEQKIKKKPEPIVHPNIKNDDLIKEVNELKMIVKNLPKENQLINHLTPVPIAGIQEMLDEQEVSIEIQERLLKKLTEKWYSKESDLSQENLLEILGDEIVDSLAPIAFGGVSFSKKFINVVGPTGVGKTTTLAKVAADMVIKHQKKVAFITTDTYRIAAIEQLKTYASILNIPVEVCYSLEEFRNATEKFADYDAVLIDTAGRNFRNKKYVDDLKKTIDFEKDMETFLVLSLTAKEKDMKAIYQQFALIGIDKLIFTKADETSVYGAMLNMTLQHHVGVAYITNGQDVPDDIIEASPNAIKSYLIGEN